MATMKFQSERQKVAHLLRRFGLGASEAEMDYYAKDGLSSAIDKLLNFDQTPEVVNLEVSELDPDGKVPNVRQVQAWWYHKLLTTRRPLQEKMTLFWHDHFATSAAKVNGSIIMYEQNEIFRQHGTSTFRNLLGLVSKDPAMLFWLDNQFNVKGKPNENFAREVMELFTLGIGHYSEKDVQEAARAFTGWTIGRGNQGRPVDASKKIPSQATFVFRQQQHDTGEKTILGKTGTYSGDDVLDMLCENPQTARYITTKLWEWFAYPEPDRSLIERLSYNFRQNQLDIKKLLRDIMTSPEFYSDKAYRTVYKTPIDFTVAVARQVGYGESITRNMKNAEGQLNRAALTPVQGLATSSKSMGMELLFPPDVAGWDTGASWITSATMVERISFADKLFGTSPTNRTRLGTRFPVGNLVGANPTPQEFASRLCSILDAELPPAKLKQLVDAAQKALGSGLTQQNGPTAAAAVTRLIFGSPEFQMM